jgi:prepilin-type N-terminal cleavage/methylation domain-containing protein
MTPPRTNEGFTLIELLVVIAIIGVLSSIVLSSLNTARNKGNDAAIKANLEQARTAAGLFYDSNNNRYVITTGGATDVCSATALVGGVTGIYKQVVGAAEASGLSGGAVRTAILTDTADTSPFTKATCHSCFAGQGGTNCTASSDAWAAEAPLKSSNLLVWCVDSYGFVGTSTTPLANGDAKCS